MKVPVHNLFLQGNIWYTIYLRLVKNTHLCEKVYLPLLRRAYVNGMLPTNLSKRGHLDKALWII